MLTLTDIAADPLRLTRRLEAHDGSDIVFRPLTQADTGCLADFLDALSSESRRLSTFDGYDLATARKMCDAIARYDKLRLVLADVVSARIIGLVEFSLALTSGDIARYQEAGVRLAERSDCRFGPTPADAYQGRGIGTLIFPLVTEVARLLGRSRITLWAVDDPPAGLRGYQHRGAGSSIRQGRPGSVKQSRRRHAQARTL
ncbi:GNAT family N-acetyltransferase [Streptomyces sp. A1277]|uniref:GNAT family N-acetyltransferase n=1 Tax=Streptomyces sp. A1277 TaxID=2563103 RepID=UPI0010A238EE|nr:GNAT family N-acetyltransferase [Streptomyces sp. A1277]THA34587.1 GNAT family N-acetyltransferase [Streptomyces sp. A1277]